MQMIAPVHAPEGREGPGDEPPAVDSEALLAGQTVVRILHRGKVYRLRATRQGKLLLTK